MNIEILFDFWIQVYEGFWYNSSRWNACHILLLFKVGKFSYNCCYLVLMTLGKAISNIPKYDGLHKRYYDSIKGLVLLLDINDYLWQWDSYPYEISVVGLW